MNIDARIRNGEIVSMSEDCFCPECGTRKQTRKKKQIVAKKALTVKGKDGKRVKYGTRVIDADGKVTTLLTPAGKNAKAAEELRTGVQLTNDGEIKLYKHGKPKKLSKAQKAWRAGRLDAAKDSANCYNAKAGKPRKGR